jgi:hypothetical protein
MELPLDIAATVPIQLRRIGHKGLSRLKTIIPGPIPLAPGLVPISTAILKQHRTCITLKQEISPPYNVEIGHGLLWFCKQYATAAMLCRSKATNWSMLEPVLLHLDLPSKFLSIRPHQQLSFSHSSMRTMNVQFLLIPPG